MTSLTDPRGRTHEERAYYSFSRRAYAIFAPVYDAVVFPFRTLRHEVASTVDLGAGARILDVATGTGQQAFAFAKNARKVVGIDLSDAMLRIARKKNQFPNVTFLQADAAEVPFDEASFDASCVSFALHEMPASVRERVVREMARVTRPGGSIVIVDYGLPRNRFSRAIVFHIVKLYERHHYESFVKSDWQTLLESAGVEISGDRPALRGMARVLNGRRVASIASAHAESRKTGEVPLAGATALE